MKILNSMIENQEQYYNLAKLIMETAPVLMRKMRHRIMEASQGQLTLSQYRILSHIARGENSITAIAQSLGVTQPSMSKMIETLIKLKLIMKKESIVDKRRTVLKLTKLGEKMFKQIKNQALDKMSESFQKIELHDVVTMQRALVDMQKVLKKWI